MIEALERIYSFFRFPFPFCFGVAFIGIVLLLSSNVLKSLKINSKKIQIIGFILIGQLFIVGLILVLLQSIILNEIRNEFIRILESPKTQIVQTDKNFGIFTSDELKVELIKIKEYSPHHSGTSNEMKLKLVNPDNNFNIKVFRDSQNPNEYWIFTDKYWFGSKDEEIGRITTNKFK
ncbi:hypothetical protein [Chryseobacterium sp.]|uniref:hypothetical protein n=1 Tax=Chryseobacterium sp. TaxID=1871047 RepID=UPI0011CA5FCF|nr:hypothetical protein [Chryseobacterium sp.]TXF79589.1 hypothetical protein FUA25_04185 [Chryseobacterium sp.]